MKFPMMILPALALAGCATGEYESAASERMKAADIKVAEKLEGYSVAGTRSCLPSRLNSGMHIHDNQVVLVRQSGRYFHQKLGDGCRNASDFHTTLVTKGTFGTMCRGDIATVVDSSTGMFSGSCALGEWTEYRKSDSAS